MFESEFIVYVEKEKKQKYKCILAEVDPWSELVVNGKVKIVYFEIFKDRRRAKSKLKKLQSLNCSKLIEMIKNSNPEMLNLINCFNNF